MANVVIDDSSLYAIGDALRDKLGESHIEQVYVETIHHPETTKDMEPRIAKTSNATGFDTRSGGYGNNVNDTQTVTVEGASKLSITVAYQTESTNYDYLTINYGSVKYGGNTLTQTTLTVDGDTATFTFKSDSSSDAYLGYYAEVIGLDADGNVLQEPVPAWDEDVYADVEVANVYKPREMAAAISSINGQMKYADVYSSDGLSFDLSPYINDDDKFILFYSQRYRTDNTDKHNGIFTTFFTEEQQEYPHHYYPSVSNTVGITGWSSMGEVASSYHAVGYYNSNYKGVTISFENGILKNSHGVGTWAILVYAD